MPSLSCKQVYHCRAVGCFIFMSARCSWSHAAVPTGARAFTERHSRQSSAMIRRSLEPSAMADLNRRLSRHAAAFVDKILQMARGLSRAIEATYSLTDRPGIDTKKT